VADLRRAGDRSTAAHFDVADLRHLYRLFLDSWQAERERVVALPRLKARIAWSLSSSASSKESLKSFIDAQQNMSFYVARYPLKLWILVKFRQLLLLIEVCHHFALHIPSVAPLLQSRVVRLAAVF
jgi:hypothetical protein